MRKTIGFAGSQCDLYQVSHLAEYQSELTVEILVYILDGQTRSVVGYM